MADEATTPDETDVDEVEDTEVDETTVDEKPKPKIPAPAKPADDQAADPKDMALRKANREASERRRRITELEAKLADLEAENASEGEKAVIKARQEAAAERDKVLRPAVVKATARAALSSAGCTDKTVQTTLMRLLDTDAVDIGDDGEVIGGLDEQIDSLREQFPEKFETKKPTRVPSAREVDAGDKKPPAVKKSATERQVESLFGMARHP